MNDAPLIVLVEDNPDDVTLTLRSLAAKGLDQRVLVLRDGWMALDYLLGRGVHAERDLSVQPRVVLLDLTLPRVDGFQVLEQLRGHRATCKLPIVVLTSSDNRADCDQAYQLGANSFIQKPVVLAEFMEATGSLGLYWTTLNQAAPPISRVRVEPWHSTRSIDRKVYHDSPRCTEGQSIPVAYRTRGPAGLPQCPTCQRLSGEIPTP